MFFSALQNNTMLSLCQLLLFFAASMSQNITRDDNRESSSNFSKAVVDENEILSMIEQQATLCPYIHLCSHTNRSTSTFVSNKAGEYPCCSECSCHVSCIAEGTCCPDFVYDGSELEVKSVKQKDAEKIAEGMECVRTNHGFFTKNSDGHQMIASCPGNFTNKAIKELCEINIHIRDTDTLVDVIPVFVNESSISYKNIFCFLCNKADDDETNAVNFHSGTFWHSRIYCYHTMLSFLYIEPDPFMFWRRLLHNGCNIVFYSSVGTKGGSKPCTFNIETCKSEFAATKLETHCKHYKWPITGRPMSRAYKTETYKNYACMLCNGGTFSENCFQYTPDSSLSSIFLTMTELAFVANLIRNKPEKSYSDLIYINQTVDTYFPDSKGNIQCKKGFILDEHTNECRQVLCPENFFLNNGTCFPMFDKTEGVCYYHLFQVKFSASFNVENTDALEDALVLATEENLNKLIGAGKYNLTLWIDAYVQSKSNQRYFVLVFLDDKYAGGDYLQLLTVFYRLGNSIHQLEVGENDSSENIFEVEFRLTMGYKLQKNVFLGITGEVLHPRRPNNFSAKRNILHVSMSLLCYRLGIATSEVDRANSRVSLFVKRTKTIISFPNFQRLNLDFDFRIIVCLEYALSDIASRNRYIFDEYPSKKKAPRMVLNQGESRLKNYEYAKDIKKEKEADPLRMSILMSVVTLFVVFIVVGSRVLLKRFTNRQA